MTRCMAVCGMTSDIEPNIPMATAAGSAVASEVEVNKPNCPAAADAGLSVPYIANLENGRGNPTTAALRRLAEALDLRLVVTLAPEDDGAAAPAEIPASLVRLGRTRRFRQTVTAMATALARDADELAAQLVAALAALAQALGRELAEADWWRLLDALLLVAAHPSAPVPDRSEPRGSLR
jgi:transcriptional regulator with XRE-family HTH domain